MNILGIIFEDVFIEHSSLPELSLDEIDMSASFLGKKISYPIMIDAMTGGIKEAEEINESLSKLAREFNIPMAVGSETIALEDFNTRSFELVGKNLKDKIKIGNLSAKCGLEEVNKAISLIDADAIELHLNFCQELIMPEGDRDFRGILDNIENIVNGSKVPVIVKEVGFGISLDSARALYERGVRYINISGHGGTNFIEIEDLRNEEEDFSDLYHWGNPSAKILIDYKNNLNKDDLFIISSGGIKTSLDILKSFALGADLVSISGELLKYLAHGGEEYARMYLNSLINKLRILMLLTGKKNVKQLKEIKYKTVGRLKDLTE